MGSICNMNNASRSAAVLAKDPNYLSYWQRFVGATITGINMVANDPNIGTITLVFTVSMPDGTNPTTETLDGPTLREASDSGILGMGLEELYEEETELRDLMTAAADDPTNGLDEDDRAAIREEIGELEEYYY